MNLNITAEFENYQNADRALSQIRRISKSIYCDEATADTDDNALTSPFVVPVSPDYFRLCPIVNNDVYESNDGNAKINISADCRYQEEIEKIIRNHNGSIESKAAIEQ